MKFAHLADLHLGSWKNPKMQEANFQAFRKALDICIENKVKFVLIAGDIFDSALPSIDILKDATSEFKRLKDKEIDCFVIPGSHDFSVSGKSFVDVLEKAGLCRNINQTIFENDGILIAGIGGKKSGLEMQDIRNFSKNIQIKEENKFKIFMLHSSLKEIANFPGEHLSVSELPNGFNYYASGHIHIPIEFLEEGKKIISPGPIFPNNFKELENLREGSFYIVDFSDKEIKTEKIPLKIKKVLKLDINIEGKNPLEATNIIKKTIENENLKDKILLLRISGIIEGKISDINFEEISTLSEESYALLRNISDLSSKELEIEAEFKSKDVDEIEKEIIDKIDISEFKKFLPLLLKIDMEKQEGETSSVYEKRLSDELIKILNLKEILE